MIVETALLFALTGFLVGLMAGSKLAPKFGKYEEHRE